MLISSYNPQEMGDVLVVITGPDVADQIVNSKGNVTQITAAKDGSLLGYNFFNASEVFPELKSERGQVFLSVREKLPVVGLTNGGSPINVSQLKPKPTKAVLPV